MLILILCFTYLFDTRVSYLRKSVFCIDLMVLINLLFRYTWAEKINEPVQRYFLLTSDLKYGLAAVGEDYKLQMVESKKSSKFETLLDSKRIKLPGTDKLLLNNANVLKMDERQASAEHQIAEVVKTPLGYSVQLENNMCLSYDINSLDVDLKECDQSPSQTFVRSVSTEFFKITDNTNRYEITVGSTNLFIINSIHDGDMFYYDINRKILGNAFDQNEVMKINELNTYMDKYEVDSKENKIEMIPVGPESFNIKQGASCLTWLYETQTINLVECDGSEEQVFKKIKMDINSQKKVIN